MTHLWECLKLNTLTISRDDKNVRQQERSGTAARNVNSARPLRNSARPLRNSLPVSYKVKQMPMIWEVTLPLGIHPREMKYIYKKACI